VEPQHLELSPLRRSTSDRNGSQPWKAGPYARFQFPVSWLNFAVSTPVSKCKPPPT